jgi:hypothetical protein
MSWRWKGGVEDPGESRIEITLKAVSEGTELTVTHSQLRDEDTRRKPRTGLEGLARQAGSAFHVPEYTSDPRRSSVANPEPAPARMS